jgi:MFS transporter, ACS family, D-galactonate transporter
MSYLVMGFRDSTSQSTLPRTLVGVLILLWLSVFLNYIDRSNLSIAAPQLKLELGLSATQLGVLLSAFFWTYACLQIPAGWLVDHLDVKWVFAAGFCVWSAATAITGILHSFAALLAVRIVLGVGESVAYPSYSKIIANHFPLARRGFANSIVASGLCLGPSFGMLFGGTLMGRFGWRPFFLILGSVSLLWIVPWSLWMPRARSSGNGHVNPSRSTGPGLLEIVARRAWVATATGLFCANYVNYFLLTWLPYYLVRERVVVGGLWAGVFFMGAVVAPRSVSVGLLMVAGIGFGMTSANVWAVTQTLAGPQAAGRWAGAQNFIGNLSGAVAPALTGVLVDRTGHFFWPFIITGLMAWSGSAVWAFLLGPIEPVVWKTNPEGIERPAFESAVIGPALRDE